jgi:hypothetical protein
MLKKLACFLSLIAVMGLAGCATPPEGSASGGPENVVELTRAIASLGPGVDPEEAARAASIAYSYTRQLAAEYEITDPPLVHNMKVNAGIKPRGLCWHWAEDMQNRLNAEGFKTLDVHRAIANADNPFLIDHSTALISAAGDTMFEAIVLDPWRYGGVLFWSPTLEDERYTWVPQAEVHQWIRARKEARARWQ